MMFRRVWVWWRRWQRGEPLTRRWENYRRGEEVHTVPRADLHAHWIDDGDDCPCEPTTEPVKREDGSIGWHILHRAFDGRELYERVETP
jgi:hypothetical protein